MFSKKRNRVGKGKLTQFQAMATALGSTVGTSSIAGVATAIFFGGPGAVFWMWISAFLGMMTGYAEKTMAIRYRRRDRNGAWKGGPSEYMKRGLGFPLLAKCFCIACICASFSGGNLVQANSIASGMKFAFGVDPHITGAIVAGVTALVILGGIGRIGRVSSALVPLMALLFTSGGLCVLAFHYRVIPTVLEEIVVSACSFQAAAGGGVGYGIASAMRYGVARGVFTNEAGLGSSAMAHAVAETESEHNQGLWGMLEVFLATLIIATISALVILTSGIYHSGDALKTLETGMFDPSMLGVPLAIRSFETVMGVWSGPFIAVCLTLFALSSILGWSYYGERCMEELFDSPKGKLLYRTAFIVLIMVGSVSDVGMVWEIADLFNGLMAIPNLLALLLLSPQVLAIWKRNQKEGLLVKHQAT
jgi:AGCS family alanine or glycine:cation symporter